MKQSTAKVTFHSLEMKFPFEKRTILKNFIVSLFAAEEREFQSMNYIFCSDAYLLEMNNNFLQHNYYTDIITFNLADKGTPIIGEAYISIDRVRDNAITFKSPFKEELLRVILHGALHLCGYKDKSKREIEIMRSKEIEYMSLYAAYCRNIL